MYDDEPFETGCPHCGSETFRKVSPKGFGFTMDRLCRECETRYTVPTPRWAAWTAVILGGVVLLALVGLTVVVAISGRNPRDMVFSIGAAAFLGGLPVAFGIRELQRHPEDQRNRIV